MKEIRFSPNKDNANAVSKFVQGAKTLDVAIYSLTNIEIAEAIKRVQKSNAKVRVLCDKQQAQIKNALCKTVGGRVDTRSGLMHNKFIIKDNECVLTGSFNFTKNAVYPNRENFIIICDKATAQAYTNEFDRLWKNNT